MAAGMDMSLDELINKSTARRKNNAVHGHGPNRHLAVRNPVRMMPYSVSQPQEVMKMQVAREEWRRSSVDVQEMVLDHGAVQTKPITKLYLSNLDQRVTDEDIHLLFLEEGELERYSIHYDQFGRSKGTAEVVFTRQSDALAALKRYNNMKLDGKTLQIELVGSSLVTTAAATTPLDSILGRPNNGFVRCGIPIPGLMNSGTSLVTPADMPPALGRSSLLGIPSDVFVREERKINSFAHGHLPRAKVHTQKASFKDIDHGFERYRRRVQAKRHIPKLSVEDLDEDLEKYRSEAKQICKKN
ncbi:THO complex subunit 4A-like [Trifolium pratense]|nr:THO complex subunit 4A-like [Trifolium pratense]